MNDKTKYIQIFNDLNTIVDYMNSSKNKLDLIKQELLENFMIDDKGYCIDEINENINKLNSYVNYLNLEVIPYCKNMMNNL